MQDGGRWWYAHEGSGYATGWERIGGEWYLFDGSGWMLTGWQQVGGAWYYLKPSGAMASDEWAGDYWLTSSGAMATDAWVDGGRYYVGASGAWVPGMQPSTPDKPSQPEENVVTLD